MSSRLSNATHLAYTVHQGRGPYLVLLHGFLSSAAQWQPNLAALGQVCTPVTVELWGHGNSPAPTAAADYTPARYVAELENIRRKLNTERWLLCGYSLGAGLIMRYAHQYPECTIAYIVTNSQSAFASPELLEDWRKQMPATADRIRAKGLEAVRRMPIHPRFAKRLPETLQTILREDAERLNPEAVAQTLLVTNLQVSVQSIAAAIQHPALLAWGRHEGRFDAGKNWAIEHMHNLQVAELDAGHGVNMEDIEGFNQAVVNFIEQQSA
ncbi:MAG: alpha/beta fold hydrolase [Pseudomonadota bacterium]